MHSFFDAGAAMRRTLLHGRAEPLFFYSVYRSPKSIFFSIAGIARLARYLVAADFIILPSNDDTGQLHFDDVYFR